MRTDAQVRKERSLETLRTERVPYLDHLPPIETEAQSRRRTSKEVARRALALAIVAAKGHGISENMTNLLVYKYGGPDFSPEENAFLANRNPSSDDRVGFSWRYESYWVLLWALGFIESLGRPAQECDVEWATGILEEWGRTEFLKRARLRPQRELLDAADLLYRYHWATLDASLAGRVAPGDLDPAVVDEWHYALTWLIARGDQSWDRVSRGRYQDRA
jgi:hypothetical protein